MAYGKSKGKHCKSDSEQAPVRMPKKPLRPVGGKSKTRTGNVSGPKHS